MSGCPNTLTYDRYAFFDTNGYLIVENALEDDQLAQIQEAFYRVEAET